MSMCRILRYGGFNNQSSNNRQPIDDQKSLINNVPQAGRPESPPSGGTDGRDLIPADPRRRQHDPLRETVAALNPYFSLRKIQDLDPDFVVRARIIGVHDAHAVGHQQSSLERRAASGENSQEVSGPGLR
jgi:hypothetical protein